MMAGGVTLDYLGEFGLGGYGLEVLEGGYL